MTEEIFDPTKPFEKVMSFSLRYDGISLTMAKEILFRQMWEYLNKIIPTEYKHVVKEEYYIDNNVKKLYFTCSYKPLI